MRNAAPDPRAARGEEEVRQKVAEKKLAALEKRFDEKVLVLKT